MIFEPDNYKNNWYGWITNQCGHMVLGQIMFVAAMGLAWFSMSEFPSRNAAWVTITVIYAIFEFVIQRGYKWDSLEDAIFVCLYGAGIPAMTLYEIEPGSTMFRGDFMLIIPVVALFCFHATVGVLIRVYGRRG